MIRNEIIISLSPASPQFVGVWSPDCVHHIIIIPVPLSQAVIKRNFPSFQLERIVIPVCYNTHVQTRDGVGRKGSWMSEPGFVTRDMRRIRHSDTQSLSRDHKPRNPLPSQPCHGDTTQIREMIFINHGTWTDWGSGNALQIGGTMPGLPGHHYTIINSMSLCGEI